MNKFRNHPSIRIVMICIVLVLAIGIILSSVQMKPSTPRPEIEQGVLDLTDWNLATDGIVKLDGEWEFYWGQLLEHDEISSGSLPHGTGYVGVPNVWNNYELDGRPLPGQGYATYRLQVIMKQFPDTLALKIPTMSTAYTVMIDGQIVAESGKAAKSKESAEPAYVPQTVVIQPSSGKFDIIVHVSNYLYARGGMWYALELADENQLTARDREEFAVHMIILGSALVLGLYHLVIFQLRRSSKSALVFGFLCFIVVLRLMGVNDVFLPDLSPEAHLRLITFIEYFTYYGAITIATLFMRQLYPDEFSKKIIVPLVSVAAAFTVSVIIFPAEFYTRWLSIFHVFAALCSIYYVTGLILAVWRKRGGAWLQVTGVFISTAALVYDMLYLEDPYIFNWFGEPIVYYGFFVLLFVQAAELARRFSKAYHTIETMSEKLISLDRLKDEFLANTTHELRTPLHGVLNLSQSVLESAAGRLNKTERANLSAVVSVASRLSNLINDLLDFSKLKNGELVLRKKAVDLRSLVSVALEMFRHMADGKQIVLADELPEDLPYVHADEDRLAQILYNLIGNALKFTAEGEIRVTAKAKDRWLEISVHDTGIGIEKDKQNAIFESFEQAGRAITKEYGGTGLGLSITKRLVELHDGTIRVESEPDNGSVFTFTMPKATGADERMEETSGVNERKHMLAEIATGAQEQFFDTNRTDGSGDSTILVADDDPINRQVLISLLSAEHYSVIAVPDGMEALAELKNNNSIDMAVIDLMMPGMSGYDVCREIRQRHSLSELPVLLLTARNQPEDILAAFQAGVNDFLSKPVESGELKARIRTLLKMKTSAGELVNVEMAFLHAQIKPHFLYNALNTIAACCETDSREAGELIISLSKYLRGTLDFANLGNLVSADKELALVKAYLNIEKARFEDLKVQFDIEDEIDVQLPPMTLQTLVENAVKHGVNTKDSGGTVLISIKHLQEGIRFAVEDDGSGMSEQQIEEILKAPRNEGSVGLYNINTRLEQRYGKGLIFTSKSGVGTKVSFIVPDGRNG